MGNTEVLDSYGVFRNALADRQLWKIHVWDIRREVGTRLEPIELDDLKTGVL